jgi:putative transposase
VPLRRPTRLPGFSYQGFCRYSLRFATFNRRRYFVGTDVVTAAREQLERTSSDCAFAVLAYCFMPGHVHLVLEGTSDRSDLRAFIKMSKQRFEFALRRGFSIYPLWQEGCYERVIRSDEATHVVIRYVLENPVRAGLAEKAEDYPFSGAMYWPEAL